MKDPTQDVFISNVSSCFPVCVWRSVIFVKTCQSTYTYYFTVARLKIPKLNISMSEQILTEKGCLVHMWKHDKVKVEYVFCDTI